MSLLDWGSLALSALAAVLALLCIFAGWEVAVAGGGSGLRTRDALRIFGVGQVGKYVPGAVWTVVTQARLAARHGAAGMRVASGSLVALAVSVCVGLALGGALLPFGDTN